MGTITRNWGKTPLKTAVAMACGALTCYAFGTAWFMLLTKTDLWAALVTCVIPFLAGDVVKIVLAVLLCKGLEKPLAKIGFTK